MLTQPRKLPLLFYPQSVPRQIAISRQPAHLFLYYYRAGEASALPCSSWFFVHARQDRFQRRGKVSSCIIPSTFFSSPSQLQDSNTPVSSFSLHFRSLVFLQQKSLHKMVSFLLLFFPHTAWIKLLSLLHSSLWRPRFSSSNTAKEKKVLSTFLVSTELTGEVFTRK